MHSGTEKNDVSRNRYELEGDLAGSLRLCRESKELIDSLPLPLWLSGPLAVTG